MTRRHEIFHRGPLKPPEPLFDKNCSAQVDYPPFFEHPILNSPYERPGRYWDDADLQEVYDTERHLLYVACTRARDHLLVTGVEPASEFLDDLKG